MNRMADINVLLVMVGGEAMPDASLGSARKVPQESACVIRGSWGRISGTSFLRPFTDR